MKNTMVIAEVGQGHDGSLGILHSFIDAVASAKVDVIKFQTHIANAESSPYEPFRVPFSYEDKSRFDYWKRMEFTKPQWKEIKQHCEDVGLEFMSSPFCLKAVDLLEDINVKRYKIASGEIGNRLLLEKIIDTGKDIILSTGLTDLEELKSVVEFITSKNKNKLSILQCTTKYPTKPVDVGLNIMQDYIALFPNLDIGLSDHSGEIYPSLAAVSLGATIIECHVTFSKEMFGPDSTSSLTLEKFRELVKGIRFIDEMINNPINKDKMLDNNLKNMFGKSLCVNKQMKKGDILTKGDLETKKPFGYGVDANKYNCVINKKLNLDLGIYEFLKEEHLQ